MSCEDRERIKPVYSRSERTPVLIPPFSAVVYLVSKLDAAEDQGKKLDEGNGDPGSRSLGPQEVPGTANKEDYYGAVVSPPPSGQDSGHP